MSFETRKYARTYRRPRSIILRVIEGPSTGLEKRLQLKDNRPVCGGRSGVNDLILDDEHVSARHFELELGDQGILLRDCGSRNGLVVAGMRVREVWIEPNTRFRAGQSVIELAASDPIKVEFAAVDHFEELHGRSAEMRELFAILSRIATRGDELRILIHGETGTGKELAAHALHGLSRRARGPFIVENCGAIPRDIAESVLFGHMKGAFTGAITDKPGKFEVAHGGTLFLDEIGDLPLDLQVKLLRTLEAGTVQRVGDHVPRAVDVRVIAATHRDLRQMVADGTFREDLYFRLAQFELEMPSLRDRGDDVIMLADLFLRRRAERTGVRRQLSPDACMALLQYRWPGNVRELKSVIARAEIMADGDLITHEHLSLPSDVRAAGGSLQEDIFVLQHKQALREFERQYFMRLLAQHATRVQVARAAGMTDEGLRLALRRLEIVP